MERLNWFKTSIKEIGFLPEKSGVYIFSVLLKNQEYGVFYVGQATNIKTRVNQHFSDSEDNVKLRDFLRKNYTFKISYAECRESILDKIEKFLIDHYKPFCNLQDGNGDRVEECSLPNVVIWRQD